MTRPQYAIRDLPPTAGLPLTRADLLRTPMEQLGEGLRRWLGIPDPIITCSGTAALVVALAALRQRDPARTQLIVPAYTCPLVALALHFVPGVELVVCDLSPHSINLDPDHLAALCTERTLAVLVTHLGGRVADTAAARTIAEPYGISVIEDAAQALGAMCQGKSVGLGGDIGFFSLAAGKGLTMYEGGILFSRTPGLHSLLQKTAQALLPANFFWNARRIVELLGYAFFYRPDRLRHVYGNRLRKNLDAGDDVAAAGDNFSLADIPLHTPDAYRQRIAANALTRLPGFLERGRIQARGRIAALHWAGAVEVITDAPGDTGTWPFLMVRMQSAQERDAVLARLWRQGLGISTLFARTLPEYPFLAPQLSTAPPCPHAREFAACMFTLTNTHWLLDIDFHRIVEEIRMAIG